MPDSSGTYSLAEPVPENGQTGDATPIAANLEDIAAALTARVLADGTKAYTADQPMGGFKHTNVADAAARTEYAAAGQVADGNLVYGGTAGGTANAITIALSPAIEATYVVGAEFNYKSGASANTGAVTVNVNSRGAGALTWPDGTALAPGDHPANAQIKIRVATTAPTFHLMSTARSPLSLSLMVARGAIWGLTYANNGSDATNDIDIAAGGCMDATGAYWIALSAITKRLDAAWAVGTNQGGRDTGSIADGDWYIWAIARSDTGVTDALFSTSATSPTMPANYDYKRLIGYFRRNAGAIITFFTYETAGGGLEYNLRVPLNSISLSGSLAETRSTDAVTGIPQAFSTIAHLRVSALDASIVFYAIVTCPDETDAAPGQTSPGNNISESTAGQLANSELRVRTDSSGRVSSRAAFVSGSGTIDTFVIVCHGFTWSRR